MPTASRLLKLLKLNSLSDDTVLRALLQKQYFPSVKEHGEELPELLSSETFSKACATELSATTKANKPFAGWTELRVRRFDGLVRRFGVPHPVPYATLSLHIANHWNDIEILLRSKHSRIKPSFHADGRIVHMNYEAPDERYSRDVRLAQGMHFSVTADISNCFPSIYSHAIDWATRGKAVAKKKRNDKSWQALLDTYVRNCHDQETKGLVIGPAMSNLLSELILQRVDQTLDASGHQFFRFVDDYTAYTHDRESAEGFIIELQRALAEFRLDLNRRKTRIVDLRAGTGEAWMAEVQSHEPADWTPLSCARFLRQAELLAHRHPQHSVMKFAIKTMRGKRRAEDRGASLLVADELLRLCTFHPHLAPLLSSELGELDDSVRSGNAARWARIIGPLMTDAARRAETDVTLWYLYILRRILRLQVLKELWAPLVASDDDLVLLGVATWCPRARSAVRERVLNWDYYCDADYEERWLVRFELNRVGIVRDSAMSAHEKVWMPILKKHDVKLSSIR